MHTISLKEFVQPLPVCYQTDSLSVLLNVFLQDRCEQIILLNEQQELVGLISFKQLTPYVLSPASVSSSKAHSAIAPKLLRQNIQKLLATSEHPLLETPVIVSADWTLGQLVPYLTDIEQQQYVLMEASGRYLGVLDRVRVLKCLAMSSLPSHVAAQSAPLPEPEGPLSDLPTAEPDAAPLDLLVELLERLPIPIMLQTTTGHVVARNLSWREHLGDLEDPGEIGREAAFFLESIARAPLSPDSLLRGEGGEGSSQSRWLETTKPSPGEDSLNFCRLGPDVDSCICTCPTKNGQERVWQFIKIPLGDRSSSPLNRTVAVPPSHAGSQDRSKPGLPFQLATPGFSPNLGQAYLDDHPPHPFSNSIQHLWLVLAQDTTEHHQVAKELAAKNADLLQLNRLKDEFLACISHELKTPLTAVLGLSSLLKDRALGELNNRQTRYAQLIHQSGRHLVLIVNDILDLTRIETGQFELNLKLVKIRAVCNRAYEQVQRIQMWGEQMADPQATAPGASGIRFTLNIQPDLDTLIADELRLRQMLINLLSNAFKFTEFGGEVGLNVETWEGWIAFTVWDTGIGIPADKQHLIFQKFQQLENPLTRRFEGTGLGLVLTQRLARLHGGDVTFTSVEGQGSQFTILLPPSPPRAGKGTSTKVPRTNGQTVLQPSSNRLVMVVEAVPRFLENLTHQLKGLGYRVAIARSGTEAIEKIRRLQPCTIFLNPVLPLLSGWDVLTLLKSDSETAHIPVVITATQLEKSQASRNGASGFLSLPTQSDALKQCLEDVIQRSVEPPPSEAPCNLTILHLNLGSQGSASANASQNDPYRLNQLLHPHTCRILEVDDLEQADLLARVWQPNVVVLDGVLPNPSLYLKQLSQHPALAALPLITLTVEVTQAANQCPNLKVFPCLADRISPSPTAHTTQDSALLQVIQVAAGMSWLPNILLVDVATLRQAASESDPLPNTQQKRQQDRLQASIQYLQTAGFQCSVGRSWTEIFETIHLGSVDLLLICVRPVDLHPSFLEELHTLAHRAVKPPILIWNCPSHQAPFELETTLMNSLNAIAIDVLPPTTSMKDLVEQINRMLAQRG